MTSFPSSLDNLITYVRALQPDGDALDNLADAVNVADRLDEQSDALLGHFVDRARRSGAPWSQIGASMGVSKQAAQKRFVPRRESGDPTIDGQIYSRLTQRARNAIAASAAIARVNCADVVDTRHVVAGLMSDPGCVAAKIIHGTGLDGDRVCTALSLRATAARADADPAALREIECTDATRTLLRGALEAALRLGHNYIGTEHLLLGALNAEDATTSALTSLGLTAVSAEAAAAEETAMLRTQHRST